MAALLLHMAPHRKSSGCQPRCQLAVNLRKHCEFNGADAPLKSSPPFSLPKWYDGRHSDPSTKGGRASAARQRPLPFPQWHFAVCCLNILNRDGVDSSLVRIRAHALSPPLQTPPPFAPCPPERAFEHGMRRAALMPVRERQARLCGVMPSTPRTPRTGTVRE